MKRDSPIKPLCLGSVQPAQDDTRTPFSSTLYRSCSLFTLGTHPKVWHVIYYYVPRRGFCLLRKVRFTHQNLLPSTQTKMLRKTRYPYNLATFDLNVALLDIWRRITGFLLNPFMKLKVCSGWMRIAKDGVLWQALGELTIIQAIS